MFNSLVNNLSNIATGAPPKDTLKPVIESLIDEDETVLLACKSFRCLAVFTQRRCIKMDSHTAGLRENYTSILYSKVSAFTIEEKKMGELHNEVKFYLSGTSIEVVLPHREDMKTVFKLLSKHIR